MKITVENALAEYPKVREGMPENVEKTFNNEKFAKMFKFYGKSDQITRTIDLWLDAVNKELEKRAEAPKDEPKEEKPKDKKMLVWKINEDGEREEITFVNNLTPIENLVSAVLLNYKHINVGDETEREKCRNEIKKSGQHYIWNAPSENVSFLVRVDGAAKAPKAEPKAEPKPKAEKPKKQPKFKVGDWIADKDGRPAKIIRIIEENGGYGYVYMYNDTEWVVSERKAKKCEPTTTTTTEPKPKKEAKAEKQPKEKKAKEKKEPEGEPVAKISPEVAIIKRFVNCCKGKNAGNEKGRESARKILAALQKHIERKEIRKTSQYAKEIMDIQKALLTIVYKKQKADFDKAEFESLEKIAASEYQEAITKLSISFIGLIGKVGVKDNAKSLLEKFEKAEVSGDLVDTMKKALKAYIDGKTTTIETEERSLQGIYGLAGI